MDIDEMGLTSWIAACSAPSSKCTTADRLAFDKSGRHVGRGERHATRLREPHLMQMGMLTRTRAAAA